MAKGFKAGSKKPADTSSAERKPITSDARFASVHNDPRFRMPHAKNLKVKVDERFSKKELNKLNVGATGHKLKIDRYGRKVHNSQSGKDFDKYYEEAKEASDEEDETVEQIEKRLAEELKGKSSESADENDVMLDRARGEGLGLDSSSDSDSDSSSDSDDSVDLEDEESEVELDEGKPEEGEPSSAFAVVNMDWDNVRAVDLMATFVSFVPRGGRIESITIYPSEFGKEQMSKEETEGPPKDLFKSKKKLKAKQADSDSESDIEVDVNNPETLKRAAEKLYVEDDGEVDYDSKALRRYQLQRLRYYYAVVRCDSIATAKAIYDNCDGSEFESTANIFDLRYVPEGMDFDDGDAKDTCTKIPALYKPDSTFVTDALQHSKVRLTWDETPKERLTLASKAFLQKEIDEMDFKAYLASDSDDEGEDKHKYQSLLGGKFGSKNQDGGDSDDENKDVDMEITFNPGLDVEKAQREEKEAQEESTIAAYKRKEKERRKKRLEKLKLLLAEDEKETAYGDKKTKEKKKFVPEVDPKAAAELELVMMKDNGEEGDAEKHFSMKDVLKAEKNKKRKNKGKKRGNTDEELVQDGFVANLDDSRFNEIFENHDFAIDPTSSEFKKTETMKQILNERTKRRKMSKNSQKDGAVAQDAKLNTNSDTASLVAKLKRKQKRNK